MATDIRTQQTLEPVHVRTEPQQISGASGQPEQATAEPVGTAGESRPIQPLTPKPQPQLKTKAPPKKSDNGVTAAIAATVIIVFGLAILAVYAYMKTKHS